MKEQTDKNETAQRHVKVDGGVLMAHDGFVGFSPDPVFPPGYRAPHDGPTVKVKRIGEHTLPIPTYATDGAAGLDLRYAVAEPVTLRRGGSTGFPHFDPVPPEPAWLPIGFAIEIPPGYEGQIRGRSGLAAKHSVVAFHPGTIDSDFRGEPKVALVNWGTEDFVIEPGDRIAQLVIAPVARALLVEVDALSETARGEGGYGSTGVK